MVEVIQDAVSGADKRAQALLEARRRDSDAKRAHVRETVQKMVLASERITFAAVARRAKVSSWLVYAVGVREHIEAAISQQAQEPRTTRDDGFASAASLRTDLVLAREEIKRLRVDHENIRVKAQRLLGQQLDQETVKQLHERMDALVDENQTLTSSLEGATHENSALKEQVVELENTVAAVRTSLRRMIRSQSSTHEG
jgi:myosin heavy subunit